MDSSFVGGDVQFTELEDALLSSFDVVAPSVSLCVVVLCVGLPFVEKFLEEVVGVAVHARCAWLNEGLCNIVDDLVIQS